MGHVARLGAAVAVAIALAGCSTASGPERGSASATAPATVPADAAQPPSASGVPPVAASRCPVWLEAQRQGRGRLYALDPATSTVHIHVFRAGRLAALGHNHVVGAEQRVSGQVYLPGEGLAEAGAELGFRLDELVLDRADWRAAVGGDFARPLSEADIAGTRANMLKALEADRFPAVRASTVSVEGGWPRLALRLAVSLHGQTRTLDLPMNAVQPKADEPLRARGQFVIRQSDFGIKPFAVLGGLLAIQDALVVDLDLTAKPAAACAALPG